MYSEKKIQRTRRRHNGSGSAPVCKRRKKFTKKKRAGTAVWNAGNCLKTHKRKNID